jgi:hypothetical protein
MRASASTQMRGGASRRPRPGAASMQQLRSEVDWSRPKKAAILIRQLQRVSCSRRWSGERSLSGSDQKH